MSLRRPHAAIAPILSAFFALAVAAPAATQQPDALHDLAPGDRVRVETTTDGRVVGTLGAHSEDGLLVLYGDRELLLADSTIERLEVSLGRSGSPGRGALIGGGIGTVFGLLGGLSAASDGFFEIGTGGVVAITALGAAMGAGAGALVGLMVTDEEWVSVGSGGVGLTLSPPQGAVTVRVPLGGGR